MLRPLPGVAAIATGLWVMLWALPADGPTFRVIPGLGCVTCGASCPVASGPGLLEQGREYTQLFVESGSVHFISAPDEKKNAL